MSFATHLLLPEGISGRRLPFYLAMEEWAARTLPAGEYFFAWRVAPTVIFGRNQRIDAEVALDYCRREGIEFYRRRSGGGCVYADMDNLMLSFVAPGDNITAIFSDWSHRLAAMVSALGVDAEVSGRNDVLIGGRKVSGGAFYHQGGRSIAHNTLLISTNLQHMLNAITPSRSKMEQKHVQSVAARITTVAEHLPGIAVEQVWHHAVASLTDRELVLTDSDIAAIEEIERAYYSPQWIAGRHGRLDISRSLRIDGVGNVDADISLDGGMIAKIALSGDFFQLADTEVLLRSLIGAEPARQALARRLDGIDAADYIAGITNDNFIDLLTL